jgi:hypothetical protein
MGKQSRRANRRGRRDRLAATHQDSGLRVSVFTSPNVAAGEVSLTKDLRLVRSALLYADEVELISPGASMLATLRPMSRAGEIDGIQLLSQLDDETLQRLGLEQSPDQVRQVFDVLPRIMSLPETQRRMVLPLEIEQGLKEALSDLQPALAKAGDIADGVRTRAGSPDLDLAISAGVLKLDSFGFDMDMATQDQVNWYAERLRTALASHAGTLLLDEETVRFLHELDVDTPSDTVVNRATKAAAGTGLLERLPTFPDAPMDEILEVREALADGRSRYRVAVKHLATELSSTALDEALPSEIDEVWHDEVAPALHSMGETVRLSRLAWGAAKRLATDYKSVVTGGSLIVAIESLAQLSPTSTGAIAVGTNVAWQATAEVLHARAEVRKRDLVYLLDVHRKLGGTAI